MKILYILSCKNYHILMNAESSVFNSVTCIKLGLLEPSLSTIAAPKSASYLRSYSSYSPPPHIYSFFSLSLQRPLNFLSSPLLWPLLGFCHSPHFLPHTSFGKTEALSQAKRTKDFSSMGGG